MHTQLRDVSGEQLLLIRIFGGPETAAAVERELDRRALFGPGGAQRRRTWRPTVVAADPRLVA